MKFFLARTLKFVYGVDNKIWCRSYIKLEKWVKRLKKRFFLKSWWCTPFGRKSKNFKFRWYSQTICFLNHLIELITKIYESSLYDVPFKSYEASKLVVHAFLAITFEPKVVESKQYVFWIQLVETVQKTYSMITN